MNLSTHSHSLSVSRQIGYFCIGLFFILFGLGIVVASLPDLLSGKENAFFIIGALITVCSTVPYGATFLAISVFTKVIVSSDVLAYHTPALIVSAKWQDLKRFEQQKSDRSYSVVVPTSGNVTLRVWAKPIRRLFREDPTSFYIDTSEFKNTNGHSLESDILARLNSLQ